MSFGNTRALLDRLGVLLGHSPLDRDTREARLDVLNAHAAEVLEQYPWRFMQTEGDFLVWQERTYARAGNVVCNITAGTQLVTFASSLGTFLSGGYCDGLTFNDGTTDYTIGRAISATQLYLTSIHSAGTANNTSWSIKTDKVRLARDCIQPLGYIDRAGERGRLVAISRRKEELYLSPEGNGAEGDVWWMVDGDFPYDRAPDSTLNGSATAGGSLAASSIYEYCYTITYEGREGPPSTITTITTTAANLTASLTGIEDVRGSGPVASGKLKTVYRRQVSSGNISQGNVNGRWLRLSTSLTEAATTFTDDGSTTPSSDDAVALHYEGPYQFIRPRWFPAADATLRVRYLKRPRKLISDADVLEGPPVLWKLVLLRAAMEICGTNSELAKAQGWAAQAQEAMKRLKENYLETPDRPTQRQMWSVMPAGAWPLRAGTVTSDFGS
jgi:hypothetical protein